MARNIVPRVNGEGTLGTALKHFENVYTDEVNIEGNVILDGNNDIAKGNIIAFDTNADLVIENQTLGQGVTIRGTKAAGGQEILFTGDADGAITLTYAGTPVFSTASSGIALTSDFLAMGSVNIDFTAGVPQDGWALAWNNGSGQWEATEFVQGSGGSGGGIGLGGYYESIQALPVGVNPTDLVIPHGLSESPLIFSIHIRCTTPEWGYVIGEETSLLGFSHALSVNDTNIYLLYSNTTYPDNFAVASKPDGIAETPSAANWELVIRCWSNDTQAGLGGSWVSKWEGATDSVSNDWGAGTYIIMGDNTSGGEATRYTSCVVYIPDDLTGIDQIDGGASGTNPQFLVQYITGTNTFDSYSASDNIKQIYKFESFTTISDTEYVPITSHSIAVLTTSRSSSGTTTNTYTIDGFVGTGIDPARIRGIYVDVWTKGDAGNFGLAEATFPDGTTHRLAQSIGGVSSDRDANLQFIPIDDGQVDFTISASTDGGSSSDVDIVIFGALQVRTVPTLQEYDTVWIPAGAFQPDPNAGATIGVWQAPTSGMTEVYLEFDDSATKGGQATMVFPDSWDRGPIKAKVYWMPSPLDPAVGASNVLWRFNVGAIGDDEDIDFSDAFTNTDVSSSVSASANGKQQKSPASAALAVTTSGGSSLDDGDKIVFRLQRIPGSDSMSNNAWLGGVLVQFRKNSATQPW